jgi:hypothetical protein
MKRLLRYWPAIPPLAALVLLGMMHPRCLEIRPNVDFEFSLLFYDPSDIGAFVLRGANASLGRLPGRAEEPEWMEPEDIAKRLDAPPQPFAKRYYLEYPTATLALFRLGYPTPCELPAALADAHHYGIAHFIPRNEAEERLWVRLQAAAVIHVLLMTAALLGLIAVLRRGYEAGQPTGPVWLCVLPAAVFFSLNRYDVLPALATALALSCLARQRDGWSGVFLAAGVLLKVYPVLFVPIVLRYLGFKRGLRWLAGFTATIALGIGLSTAILGWEPTIRPIQVQLDRKLEAKSWTLYGRVLPIDLAGDKTARQAILAGAGLLLVLTRPPTLASVLRRCSALLIVFISLAVFWSPQWVIWFLPLVVPLAARHRWLIPVCVALDLINYFQFPVLFWILWNHFEADSLKPVAEALIYTRAGLWGVLAGGLLIAEFRRPQA